ncbi:IclR family transcriptional regulator [Frankia sp. ACN1ag]|nr:IclR family transcriptional regulator C-terminal domain-containing protein [Frankia sp. ACN1ag]
MRTFTEVGRRVPLHCTGVGKALLSTLGDDEARAILRHSTLSTHTATTIVEVDALLDELAGIRARGYALDEGEMEVGVRCVAMPVSVPGMSPMALSVSGPAVRMNDDLAGRAAPALSRACAALAAALT